MDQYFRQSHQNSETGRLLFKKRGAFALLAVGGYRRKELDFHSDIDILILFGSKIPPLAKELVEEFLYPLWDLGLDLGYGVRTIKDCLNLSKNDFEVLTSMMDARFVCGDSPLYFSLMESLHKKIAQKKAVEISHWLEGCHKIRMETFGDASHLLEPNLKEGIGGLRDYHQILWHAKALFFKILNIFLGEELATRDASQKARETLLQVQGAFPELTDTEQEILFSAMSPRYLLNRTPREIIHHVHMLKALRERQEDETAPQLAVEIKENEMESCVDITFMIRDRPGIFSRMAGVLAINHVNVVAANIYTWGDGTAVDIFKATPHPDPRRAREIWEKVEKDVEDVFRGNLPLEDHIREKSQPSILNTDYKPSHPPKIRVDNRASDFFTLIEVFADDRIGLLYKITRTLFELDLDIRIAKIATKGDQVADVFYVRDLEGQKVEDESKSGKIIETLIEALAQ